MLGVIILVIVILCVLIAAVSSKSGENSGNPPPSRPYTREIQCPTCGSPAVAHGKEWECGWCGDCGKLR